MKSLMKEIVKLSALKTNTDVALLCLRVWLGISLFAKHGYEKLFTFEEMHARFPDPLHVGPTFSLLFALLADSICSLLVSIGVATRVSALIIVVSLGVAFIFVHGFSLATINGELPYVYIGGYLAIFLAGAGRYSLDYQLIFREPVPNKHEFLRKETISPFLLLFFFQHELFG
jgi:putative oxidoreductase